MTVASSKLAKAQQLSAAKGVRNALSLYLEAAQDLAAERRYDDAVQVLLDLLNLRERKRSLFGAKEINPLAAERLSLGKHFAQFTRLAAVTDPILELLGSLAAEFPDEPELRLANAEALYRGAYIADAIDEYRYCEKISPNDGSVIARLGELYAMMSRQSEAVDYLRRGIARLQESGQCAGLAHFVLKLFEIDHECANDAHDWLYSLSDEDFAQQRTDIGRLLNAVREAGADDDSRWAAVEQRLAQLPAVVAPEPPQPQELQPQEVSASDWDTSSAGEPAGEDEMREFFAASATRSVATAQAPQNGVAAAAETQEEESAPPQPTTLQVNAGRSTATSLTEESQTSAPISAPPEKRAPVSAASSDIVSPLPPGLAAYTRRKADGLLASGDYEGASTCYERLLRAGFEPSVAEPLLRCYLESGKVSDGIALGLQLADHQSQAGELDHAVQTLAKVLEYTDDAEVTQRHSELLASLT